MTQANKQATKQLTDLASRICSPILWISELFDDIFAGGKACSYRVPSDITTADCISIAAFCHEMQSFSLAVDNSMPSNMGYTPEYKCILDLPLQVEDTYSGCSQSFLLCNTEGGEMNE